MRLGRFCFILTVFCVLAGGACAQTPVDPKVIINKTDPVCTGAMLCYTGSNGDPLVESFTNPLPFVYTDPTGTTPLTSLFIDLINVPALTEFQCQTDIWTDCSIIADAYGPNTVGFHLFGNGTGLGDNGGGICSPTCPDQLTNGEGGTFDLKPLISETPEPGSMILFATGLFSIFVARKRRLEGRSS